MAEGMDINVYPHAQERSENRRLQLQNDGPHFACQLSDAKHTSRRDQSVFAAQKCPGADGIRSGIRN